MAKKQTAKKQTAKKQTAKKQTAKVDNHNEAKTTFAPPPKRTRAFIVNTYIESGHIWEYLKTRPWLKAWAMICHDKDRYEEDVVENGVVKHTKGEIKEKHTHIVLYTYEAKTASSILKKFETLANEIAEVLGGEPQNTRVQVCSDMVASYRYLRHLDDPKKYRYPADELIESDPKYWQKLERTDGLTNNSHYQIFQEFKAGAKVDDLLARYGRDFLMNIRNFERLLLLDDAENAKESCERFLDMCLLAFDDSKYKEKDIHKFIEMLTYIQSHFIENNRNDSMFFHNFMA